MAANATFALKPGVWSCGFASSSLLLIRDENPRRRQAENPLNRLSRFSKPALATPERRLTGSRAKGRNTRDDPTIGPLRRHAKHHKCGGCAEVGALKQPPAPGRIVTAKDVKEDCPKKAGADAGPAA